MGLGGGGGGGSDKPFGIMPALVEPVRSRTSRQTPRVLRITSPFEVNGSSSTSPPYPVEDGGFAALDGKPSSARKVGLT